MSFNTTVALLIFCLDDLSIYIREVLNFLTSVILLSFSPFMYVNVCFICLGAPVLGACMSMIIISSSCIDPFIII